MERAGDDSKRPKHIEINDAIERLSHVNLNLGDLLLKLTGEDTIQDKPQATQPSSQPLSLHDVLCSTAERLSDISESIQDKINKINDMLF